MPRADAQPGGQLVDAAVVEGTLPDEVQRPAHDLGRAGPVGPARPLVGTALEAGPEAGRLGGGGELVALHVLGVGAPAAPGPAIDAGGDDPAEPAHALRSTPPSAPGLATFGHGLLHGLTRCGPGHPERDWPARGRSLGATVAAPRGIVPLRGLS